MRAEHAAVHVGLVDHDNAQVVEDVAPAVVVWEDAEMQHVRVREDRVRGAPDMRALPDGRVAVVDRGSQGAQAEAGEPARLILREGLRRVEEERARGGLARDRVEHRQREGEGLPRGGARRHDDALAALHRLPGLRLVEIERVDAAGGERRDDVRVQPRREGLGAAGSSLNRPAVGDLGSVEQDVPGGCVAQGAAPASARSAASS